MLTALYVFLVVVGYALLILVPFRLLFQKTYDRFFSKKSDMLTQFLVSAIFMLIFVSAWITDLIGIHAIFGAFLMGLAIPRSDGLPIHMTEKIEDVVNIVFLPLVSGVKPGQPSALCLPIGFGSFAVAHEKAKSLFRHVIVPIAVDRHTAKTTTPDNKQKHTEVLVLIGFSL